MGGFFLDFSLKKIETLKQLLYNYLSGHGNQFQERGIQRKQNKRQNYTTRLQFLNFCIIPSLTD
jgi:hypothetical protein